MINKVSTNKGFVNYSIARMFVNMKFDMDHIGARVENEAVIVGKSIKKELHQEIHPGCAILGRNKKKGQPTSLFPFWLEKHGTDGKNKVKRME